MSINRYINQNHHISEAIFHSKLHQFQGGSSRIKRLALGSFAVGFRPSGARHTGHLVGCRHCASILLAGSMDPGEDISMDRDTPDSRRMTLINLMMNIDEPMEPENDNDENDDNEKEMDYTNDGK